MSITNPRHFNFSVAQLTGVKRGSRHSFLPSLILHNAVNGGWSSSMSPIFVWKVHLAQLIELIIDQELIEFAYQIKKCMSFIWIFFFYSYVGQLIFSQ